MQAYIKLYKFLAKQGLPESTHQLIESGRILIITRWGEELQPISQVHRLYKGDRVLVDGLVGHSEFIVERSDFDPLQPVDKPTAIDEHHPRPSLSQDMDSEKVVDSVRFLLSSVSKLTDRFVESNESTKRSYNKLRQDIDGLMERLGKVEFCLANWKDQQLISSVSPEMSSLEPTVKQGDEKLAINALNLPIDGILETYRSSPALLQPFARACSVTGRTLSGMISEVELEVFAQGTTWLVETQDGEWLLFPRPGLVTRRSQIQSLERLFDIEAEPVPPAVLELLEPGRANVVEYGRRWYLGTKGRLGLQPDTLKVSLENRLRLLESRMRAIEDGLG